MSTNSIKALMPHPVLTHVLGEPTHKQLILILRKVTANLMAVSCPWGHNKGHLGLLQDPALYLAQNGASFNKPKYLNLAATHAINACANQELNNMHYHTTRR
jgi:hypothetical protein